MTSDPQAADPQAAPPQLSPDGRWAWDGQQWLPAPAAEGAPPAEWAPAPAGPAIMTPAFTGQPSAPKHDGLAIASLVLSLIWLMGLGSIAAVVLGHVSRNKAQQEGRPKSGVALAGLILGYLGSAFFVVGIIAAITIPALLSQRESAVRIDVEAQRRAVTVQFVLHAQQFQHPFNAGIKQTELKTNAQRHDDGRHDKTTHHDKEERAATRQFFSESKACHDGKNHCQDHDFHTQSQRSPKCRSDVHHAQALSQFVKPVQRKAAQRKCESPFRTLKTQHHNDQHWPIHKQYKQSKEQRKKPEAGRSFVVAHFLPPGHSKEKFIPS